MRIVGRRAHIFAARAAFLLLPAHLWMYLIIMGLASCDSNLMRQEEDRGRLSNQIQETTDALLKVSSEEIVAQLLDPGIAQQAKKSILQSLLFSDDLFALETLIEVTVRSDDPMLRRQGEEALIERARRQGLDRVAESTEPWLPVLSIEYSPAVYRAALQLLDRSLPHAPRLANLRLVYRENPLFALRIGGALAFDLDEREQLQPILLEFVQDALELEGASARSSPALLLVHPQLRRMFPIDMEILISQISGGELEWVLEQLAIQHSPFFQIVIKGMGASDLANPFRIIYLNMLRDKDEILQQEILLALFRGIMGKMELNDIAVLGRWIDQRSIRALLAVIVESEDSDLSIRAYEMLFEKSIHIEPVATLVSWIRKNRWKQRSYYRELVGVIGNRDLVSEERIAVTLKKYRHNLAAKNLLDSLLKVSDPSFILLLLTSVEEEMSLGRRLTLLSHEQEQARILGVKSLSGCNDFGALKVILDSYEREVSPVVRHEYEGTFPEVRRRAQGDVGSQYSFDEL